MMDEKLIFKSHSDEKRLRILDLFIKSVENLCVCELMGALKLPQFTVSKSIQFIKMWVYQNLIKNLNGLTID